MRLPDGERSRVVLIGTANYTADRELPGLPTVVNNLADLAQTLGEPVHGWLSPHTCTIIQDPGTPSELGRQLSEITPLAEDLLLIYYAGHGLLNRAGDLYLGLSETHSSDLQLRYTAMPFDGIRELVANSPASNRVVVLDCCFSGRAIDVMASVDNLVMSQTGITGSYTLTATPSGVTALAPAGQRNTAFTGELLDLLRSGDPDAPAELTLDHIYRFLYRRLRTRGLPKPRRQGTDTVADLVLARNLGYQPPPETKRRSTASGGYGTPSRLLLDEEELIGRDGDPAEAARRYGDIAGVLVRLYGTDHPDAQAAELSRAYWVVYRTPAETRTPPSEEDRALAGKRAVGIDLGSANSVICAIDSGEPEVIPNAEGAMTTPSVVAFTESGEVLVGEAARRQAVTNPDRTVQSVVRHMGTDWSFTVGSREFTAPRIASLILRKLKRDAEAHLGQEITEAVICVPTGANYDVILATREAARLAGLQPLVIAPNEWLIALGRGRWENQDLTMMVLDLGGTSFGVSLIEVGDGVVEVKAVGGDSQLGGGDWDQVLVDHLVARFRSLHDVDLTEDRMALQRLREAAERAKIELSFSTETSIDLPYLAVSVEGPLHLEEKLTRAWFQQRTANLLARCDSKIQQVLRDAGIQLSDLDHVVLVGGSTRMPAVAEFVMELTGKEANRGVNPDEVVAIGAALRVGLLKGEVKDVLILDVTPLSLGIETKGGIMTKIIERNTTIPTKRSEVFTTTEDDQVYAQIPVYQGEREIAGYNRMLGLVELTGLPRAARGVPQIAISFDIDSWGMLSVTAKVLPDGEAQTASVGDAASWSTSPRRPDALLVYPPPPVVKDAKPPASDAAAQAAQARDSQKPEGQGSSSENTTRNKRWWSR